MRGRVPEHRKESAGYLYDEINGELQRAEDQLAFPSITKVGELLPAELSLLECKSGEAIQLKTFWKQSKFTLFVPLKFYS